MTKSDLHNSIQNVINDDKPTVRKSIIIGVGGSGMKGVLSAKNWIESNMPAEAHRYMRWVGIDTTDIETSIEGKGAMYRFPSDQMKQEEKRMLYVSSPTPAELSLEFLREKFNNDKCFDWIPNPDVYDISTRAGQGANQTRALGRLAFFYNEENIRKALVKERDRLSELSDDPKYFQLMDVKEGHDKFNETITFVIERGVNRYYFGEKIPDDHIITNLKPDPPTKAILCPHIDGNLQIDHFPKDERGYYFEVSGSSFEGKKFSFKLTHFKRRGQISIFITASVVGGTGNGMFLDLAAMVRDIFKDYWPKPRIYGIIVLPSAFKRVVYNRNAKANAYAALKEIDYFMSGNPFRAEYPSGRYVEIEDRLFDDGMLYLLDVENMAGNSLQGRDQVQELTGQFISTFVSSTVGGAIEERMVNDSTRVSVYLPEYDKIQRRASYNSFGISRVLYPVPQMRDLGFKITAVKMIDSFLKPVNRKLLYETLGDINRGLVRSLRLNCRLIFERMYPDYSADIEIEMRSYEKKLKTAVEKNDRQKVLRLMENILRDYGKEEMEKIKRSFMTRMEKRYQLELQKLKLVLTEQIHGYLQDPKKGFNFAASVIDMILAKLDTYQKKYYDEKIKLSRYSTEEIENLIEAAENSSELNLKAAEAVIEMASFNFAQLLYESMLSSSEVFVREFRALLFNLKNNEVNILQDKIAALREDLIHEVEDIKFQLLEKKNPLFFYLVNGSEIELFLKEYFYSRLSIEDLCNEIDFVKLDREDDTVQLLETYLISQEGLSVLEKSSDEIKTIIQERFGAVLDKSMDEVREILYLDQESAEGSGLNLSESSMLKIDIDTIKKKLFKIIYSRFEGFSFDNISVKQLLNRKKIPVKKLFEKLDTFSRPYIYLEPGGIKSMEYFRTITNFSLNTYEEGDEASFQKNDLPERMDHYRKRESAEPNISVETFEVPNLCKPYEMISIGILLGYPIFKINSLEEPAKDYHDIVSERSHPLHLFNNPANDARYYPDPFRMRNYLNPAKLWSGLQLLKVIVEVDGRFVYDETFHDVMKDLEARENYKKVVIDIDERIASSGGIEKVSLEILSEAVNGLGMLARNSTTEKLQFRREYSLVIRDILDGDGTGDRANSKNMSKDEYIERFIKAPQFTDMGGLILFLEDNYSVREFIRNSVKDVIDRTRGNINAGADVSLPKWKIDQIRLPEFKDKFEFFDYFEDRGSLEWQNVLKTALTERLDDFVSSSKFRLESDPTLVDRKKVKEFLMSMDQKLPEIVLWEVKVRNKIIK